MPKFRKKPVVIEARQLPPAPWEAPTIRHVSDWRDIEKWCGGNIVVDAMGECILIDTLEGQMRADPGDWIIRGVAGEFYPCKPEIFAATYEAVDEGGE